MAYEAEKAEQDAAKGLKKQMDALEVKPGIGEAIKAVAKKVLEQFPDSMVFSRLENFKSERKRNKGEETTTVEFVEREKKKDLRTREGQLEGTSVWTRSNTI